MIIETHCHLDYLKNEPLDDILKKSQEAGIEKIITIAVEPDNFDSVFELSNKYPQVYFTQGVHPHDAKLFTKNTLDKIEERAKNSKFVAVGEIGLDYHYDNSPRDIQKDVFKKQLDLATKLNKPVVIHSRDAEDDTQNILINYKNLKGVIHSFTSSLELAHFAIKNNLYLGFNGIITFKKAEEVREAVRITPIEQILIETDSPFLTPTPHRGKENAPFYLPFIIDKIAQIKGISKEEVIKVTTQNALNLFWS